ATRRRLAAALRPALLPESFESERQAHGEQAQTENRATAERSRPPREAAQDPPRSRPARSAQGGRGRQHAVVPRRGQEGAAPGEGRGVRWLRLTRSSNRSFRG